MRTRALIVTGIILTLIAVSFGVSAQEGQGYNYLAAAISVGLGCIGAAYAVAKAAPAAIAAITEKPELFGKTVVFVGLGEGIAIDGLLIAILMI